MTEPIVGANEVYIPISDGYITIPNDKPDNIMPMLDKDGNIQCYCTESEYTMIS